MIFDGMIRKLDARKKFLMYPRFVQEFLNNQLSNLPVPLDNLPIPILSKKVFTNMAKKGLKFSGQVTPLSPNMLASVEVEEGEEGTGGSEGDQVQLPNDSPHLGGNTSERAEGVLNLQDLHNFCTLLSQQILDLQQHKDAQTAEILKLKTKIKKLEKKCKPSISHHRAWLRSVSILSMKEKLDHTMEYMDTEEAVNERRQSNDTEELKLDADTQVITEDKGNGEKGGSTVGTARPDVGTARLDVGTARPDVDTARQEVGTADPTTPPTTTTIFDNEEMTLADTLVKMKDDKAKDKGKGIIVEEEHVKIKRKDQGIDQIERDEELAHKLHEEELAEIARIQEEASRIAIMEMFDEVQEGIDVDALFAAKL
ncbi:hypothetical protein Tco_1364770 [Tanacetum coccineum]